MSIDLNSIDLQQWQVITQDEYDHNKFQAHLWAKNLLEKQNWVILHLAATGLGESDRITEICVLSRHGSVMLNTLVNPDMYLNLEVMNITGIDNVMTVTAPYFKDIYPQIRSLLEGKTIISYSTEFNFLKIYNELIINKLDKTINTWISLDDIYSKWHNDYWQGKQDYFYPKLFKHKQKHRAKTGALNIYNCIKQMAQPLKCNVSFFPQPFPQKQLFCDWQHFLKFGLYVDGIDNKEFYIKRPKFYWAELPNRNDTDWDYIPF